MDPLRVSRFGRLLRAPGKISLLNSFGGAPTVAGRDDGRLEARPGSRWSAAQSGGGVTLGDEVDLRPRDVAVGGEAALFKRGGFRLKAMAWRAEEVPKRVDALRARERWSAPERAPLLAALGYSETRRGQRWREARTR